MDNLRSKKVFFSVIIVIVSLLICLVSFFIIKNKNVTPDFSNNSLKQVEEFIIKNPDYKIEIVYQKDISIEKDYVIKQEKIDDKSYIVTISSGPSDEKVLLVDFSNYSKDDVFNFIKDNKLSNAKIEEVIDDDNAGKFLRIEPNVASIYPSEAITFIFAKEKKSEDSIRVPDFKNYTSSQIKSWCDTNNIKLNLIEKGSETIAAGKLISQTPEVNEEIIPSETLTIVISIGKVVVMPNAIDKTVDNVKQLISGVKVNIKTIEAYSSAIKNTIIEQSPAANKNLKDGDTVTLTVSLGLPIVPTLVGKTKDTTVSTINALNEKGANLKLIIQEGYSDSYDKNIVFYANPENKTVDIGSTITIKYSGGSEVQCLNFNGKTVQDISKWANTNGLTLKINEKYSSTINNGIIIENSPNTGRVKRGSTIDANVSIGRYYLPNFVGKTLTSSVDEISIANEKGAGVKYNILEEFHKSIESGTVISQRENDDDLILVVSKGVNPSPMEIPNMVGYTLGVAQNSDSCTKYFNCSYVYTGINPGFPTGSIYVTEQQTGSALMGANITIYYQKGPE